MNVRYLAVTEEKFEIFKEFPNEEDDTIHFFTKRYNKRRVEIAKITFNPTKSIFLLGQKKLEQTKLSKTRTHP
jgi:hypothetical protein